MKNKLLSIGEFSKLTNTHIKSLRYYEKLGILKPQYISPDSGYRYYAFNQFYMLEFIRFAIEMDFPLKNLSPFLEGEQTIDLKNFTEIIKNLAEEKIKNITKGLRYVDFFQNNMTIRESQPLDIIYSRCIEERHIYAISLTKDFDEISNMEMADIFTAMPYEDELSIEYGYLLHHTPKETTRYVFICVDKPYANFHIPAGETYCIQTNGLRINESGDIFKDILPKNSPFIAISTELYSHKFNINEAIHELRLTLP